MCGSCKEFTPIWDKLDQSMKSIVTTKVNIDDKGGMDVAKMMGVLDEGVPNVRLIHHRSSTTSAGSSSSPIVSKSIVAGDLLPYKKIMHNIKAEVGGKGYVLRISDIIYYYYYFWYYSSS